MSKTLRSFYRPHKRVTFDNEYIDPVTGEVAKMPSMTKQEFKFESDINNVIKQFKPHHMAEMLRANMAAGNYADLPDSIDYQEALHLTAEAERAFMTVPSKVRERFGHDPAVFLAFTQDPKNQEELRVLGLAPPLPSPVPPVEVKIVSTAGTGGDGGTPPVGGAKAP